MYNQLAKLTSLRLPRHLGLLVAMLVALSGIGFGQTVVKYQSLATQGGAVTSVGITSSNRAALVYPSCTVTVYLTGTLTLATIYSDASLTPLANPFTATAEGLAAFYIVPGTYDLRFSGTGIATPFTRSAVEISANAIPQYTTAGKPTCTAALLNRRIRLTDGVRGTASCVPYGSGYEWVRDSATINLALDFGVPTNGTDALSAANAALAAAISAGYEIYAPSGTYTFSDTLNYYPSGAANWGKPLRFRGDGSRRTIFKLASGVTNKPVMFMRGGGVAGGTLDITHGEVRDIGFRQTDGTGNIGLRIQGVSYTVFRGLEANNFTGGTGIEIYQTGGSGDSDLVGLCEFRDILVHNNAKGFAVNASSGVIAITQTRLVGVYAQDNTTAGFWLSNYDGLTLIDCLAIGDNITPIGIKDHYNGLYGRNLTITGGELGNGCTTAAIQLDRVVNVTLYRNRILRNNGETQDYGVQTVSGGDVINMRADLNQFNLGNTITTYTAFQLDATHTGTYIGDQHWGGTFTGGNVKVSDTTKCTFVDNTSTTDTRSSYTLGSLIVTGGNFRVASSTGYSNFLTRLSVGSTDNTIAAFYAVNATAGLTTARLQHAGIAQAIIGFNGTSVNYLDGDTQYWRSGDGLTIFGTLTSTSMAWTRSNTITSTSANALAVGANGTTNPVVKVDASTASVATGISITGAAAGSGVALTAISSGTNETITISGKGTGIAAIGDTGTASATAGAATLNTQRGTITSESLTTAAGASYTLTLTDSKITTSSMIFVSFTNGTNTQGTLELGMVTPGSGNATIIIRNSHSADALNGTIKINFLVM